MRLTKNRRKSLLKFVNKIKQGGLTNLWGGMAKALSYAGDPKVPNLKKGGIDTIYALTDGVPTVGIADPEKFIRRFAFLNRYSQVRVHTVHIGDEEGAKILLEALSEASGGHYIGR